MIDPANSAPLTFEDVVQALGETDPHATNSGKLRALLGRGSGSTVQKHLDAIRAQRIQAMQPEAVPVPPAPPELLSMWGAAVAVATAQVRTRLDSMVLARDTLTVELQSARGDVQALTEALEAAEGVADKSAGMLAEANELARKQAEADAERQAADAHAAGMLAASVEAEKQAHAKELAEANHQIELTRMQAQLGAQALQTTIDRLTDQVGELKSLLHKQAQPESVVGNS